MPIFATGICVAAFRKSERIPSTRVVLLFPIFDTRVAEIAGTVTEPVVEPLSSLFGLDAIRHSSFLPTRLHVKRTPPTVRWAPTFVQLLPLILLVSVAGLDAPTFDG
ncbi:MAG: hypothetical protein EB143_01595 [Actinobacteria bacterium]|nr:hypothetical protein [Actinomycetota bacterium]NDF82318.1 hypothetical protein [Actinomycetota bacterium]